MRRFIWLVVVILALGVPFVSAAEPQGGKQKGRSDEEIGLRGGSVFDDPAPPPSPVNDKAPGDGAPLPRPYPGAPPVIPHAVADFLPITVEENTCLLCHGDPESGATVVPPSHYLDLRHAPDQPRERVAGARWNCVVCHAGSTGAPLLVENDFTPGGAAKKQEGAKGP